MLPGAVVNAISHDFAVPSFRRVRKVVDTRAVFLGAIVGHDGAEFSVRVLPSVLERFAGAGIESIVFTSVVVSDLVCS